MIDFGDARIPDTVWARLHVEPNTGCWLWSGSTNNGGYGTVTVAGTTHLVHRLVFTQTVGVDGQHLDHLCRTRACANPSHLEAVSARENLHRGVGTASRTQCPAGHAYEGQNLHITRAGRRQCKACHRERQRTYRARSAA